MAIRDHKAYAFKVSNIDEFALLTKPTDEWILPSLTADPGVASSIPARSHTFMEIDQEIISTVILLPSAESFKKGCCQ